MNTVRRHTARAILPALVLLTLMAARSEAAITGTITLMRDPAIDVPFTSPDAALPESWVSYALGLQSTTGESVSAVYVNLYHPQLHQRWVDADLDGAFESTPNSTNVSNGDSHLRTPVGAVFGFGPIEDNSGIGSPLADTIASDYGLGTTLQGAWGVPGLNQSTGAAYIVIPKGTEHLLDLEVQIADTGGGIIKHLTELDFIPTFATGRVTGRGLVIDRGDDTPRPEDGTDFGLGPLGTTERRTFIVENTGTVPLSLGPPTFTGPFVVEGTLPATVNPGASASFSIFIKRDVPGNFLGSISFGSNSGRYTFALAGQAVPEPASIWVLGIALVELVGANCRRGRPLA